MNRCLVRTAAVSFLAILPAAMAQADAGPNLNNYGVPGLLDMPSGEFGADGDFSTTFFSAAGQSRTSLSFTIAPRVAATFRIGSVQDWTLGPATWRDSSFDLRFLALKEDPEGWKPSIVIGLQDLRGDGLSSAEYVVASKHFFDNKLTVTAGLGWGRFGSAGSFATMGNRPVVAPPHGGGRPQPDLWFTGDVAPFAGVSWKFNDKLTIKAEYSSDAYVLEDSLQGLIDVRSPVNFGAEYILGKRIKIGAQYLYGSEFGINATVLLNPSDPPVPGSLANAPTPVRPSAQAAASFGLSTPDLKQKVAQALGREGLAFEGLQITGNRATVRFGNGRYDAEGQAIGRAARALTTVLPPNVDTFVLEPVVNGIPAAAVTLSRRDLEVFENRPDGTEQVLARLDLSASTSEFGRGDQLDGLYPKFGKYVAPYFRLTVSDPANPVSADYGVSAGMSYEPRPGLVFSASASQSLAYLVNGGGSGPLPAPSTSPLPHVRSDAGLYSHDGLPTLDSMKVSYTFKPGTNLYGRVQAGYLEASFGGVAGEVLWKPVDQNYALGVELAWAKQRAFEGYTGFQDYEAVTGFVSGYYSFDSGYEVAIHAGRYLAGDWGATVDVAREFPNGWKVAAYATLTEVSSADFGPGEFDKGITVSIPMSWALGRPTRNVNNLSVLGLQRDGGARLNTGGSLYDSISDYHGQSLQDTGGLFWR